MSMSAFCRRFRRPVAGGAATVLLAAGLLTWTQGELVGERFAGLFLVGYAGGLLLLTLLAALPRIGMGLTWMLFLGASQLIGAAQGPGVGTGPAHALGWLCVVVTLVMAISTFAVKVDLAQHRSVSRL